MSQFHPPAHPSCIVQLRSSYTVVLTIFTVKQVSIHAPVRGATVICKTSGLCSLFQSTPPCGGRQYEELERQLYLCVSIHAPVRGATQYVFDSTSTDNVSIHAPVRGATSPPYRSATHAWFQSTPPCGGRPGQPLIAKNTVGFNPRPRAGGDGVQGWAAANLQQFQSTPPCGGRPGRSSTAFIAAGFYRRPRGGGARVGGGCGFRPPDIPPARALYPCRCGGWAAHPPRPAAVRNKKFV